MDKNRKLIITDLDGTLLNDNSELSKKTIATVKKISDKGHIFCISTGRPYRSAIKFYKQLGLKTVMSTLNGSHITNPIDKNFLPINLTFSKTILSRLIDNQKIISHINFMVIENYDCTYIIEKNKKVNLKDPIFENFHITEGTTQIIKESDIKKIQKDLNSILISVKKKDLDLISFEIKSLIATLVVRDWSLPQNDDDIIIEINSRYADKGGFLKYVSCYYGIPYSEVYTFGDGVNDIGMLGKTLNAFAMKNGCDSAKLVSYRITEDTNDNDGVVKALAKELKIK